MIQTIESSANPNARASALELMQSLMELSKRVSARPGEGNVWKGLAAGVGGGLVASFAMNRFQALWSKLAEREERPHGAQSLQHNYKL